VYCAAAVNPASVLDWHRHAVIAHWNCRQKRQSVRADSMLPKAPTLLNLRQTQPTMARN
jgi:hypothetical protein